VKHHSQTWGCGGAEVSFLNGEKLLLCPLFAQRTVNDADAADRNVQTNHAGLYLGFSNLSFHDKMF